jgi:hypothetical protein
MKSLKTWYLGPFLVLLFAFSVGSVWAIPIAELSYLETDLGGIWQYNYTVTNAADPVADAGFNLYDVFFTFDPTVTFTITSLPFDWDAIDGPGFADAYSLLPGAPSVGADIAPGTSLSGFIFQFDDRVGDLPFEVTFENPADLLNPVLYSGTSAPIPEPATLLLIGTGLVGLAASRKKFRK